jgi:predicted nucleic acid-binding protein
VILADTSVWIDHLRTGNQQLRQYLAEGQIVIHPFVIAELALGSLRQRSHTLALLDLLPHVRVAQISEVRRLVETRRLYGLGLGIGLVDAHLIAAVFLNLDTTLWTRDKALRKAAETLGIDAAVV